MYKKEPWTLNPEKVACSIKATKNYLFKEDIAISTSRVMNLFESNQERVYTNQDIAKELGMSLGTVSSITNRLEQLAGIKIVKVKQSVSAISQMFQHRNGSMHGVEKIKNKKDVARKVKELFEEDKNRILTKKEVINSLSKVSENQISISIRILLLNGTIKIIDNFEGNVAKYQHALGNEKGLEVLTELSNDYSKVSTYLKETKFSGDKKVFSKYLPKTCKLFYSSRGLTPVYPKKDLDKCAEKAQRKGIFAGLLR